MGVEPVRYGFLSLLRPAAAGLAVLVGGVWASGTPVFAGSNTPPATYPYEAVGTLLPHGAVSLNGVAALPHTTLYAGDTLNTLSGSRAMLTTPDGSTVHVFGGSEVAITRSRGARQDIELRLKHGAVEVRSPADHGASVVAEEVRVRSRGGMPAAFLFDHRGEDIRVTAYHGAVEISGPALRVGPAIVAAGQVAWLTAQDPQVQPQPPYPTGAGNEEKERKESARPKLAFYLLLAGGAVAGITTAIILATESDPRP